MILQSQLPYDARQERALPGVRPLEGDWLLVDDAYAAQMAERARLIEKDAAAVHALDESARAAAEELLDTVLAALPEGFVQDGGEVTRPDGVRVALDHSNPLITLGHLVPEDLCLMLPRDDVHVLAGAILCFPSGWRLAEKFNHPMVAIHDPVPSYDADIAKRVQRLFHGLQVGRPIWRFNRLWDSDPTLHKPGPRVPRPSNAAEVAPYFRSERQCLLRLPVSRAVVFSIHTYVVLRSVVSEGDRVSA